MKKVVLLLLLISSCLEGMLTTKVNNNFGRKHFIVGYDYARKVPYKTVPIKSFSSQSSNDNFLAKSDKASWELQAVIKGRPNSVKALSGEKDFIETFYDKLASEVIDESRMVQSFYTRKYNVRSIIAHILKHAKHSILIAAYNLTDASIVRILKQAHSKGVKVRVITDYSNMGKSYSKINELIRAEIPVFYYDHTLDKNRGNKSEQFLPLMHLKVIVCDGEIVITGSANLTYAGQENNFETVTLIREKQSITEHVNMFKHLKRYCRKCELSEPNKASK